MAPFLFAFLLLQFHRTPTVPDTPAPPAVVPAEERAVRLDRPDRSPAAPLRADAEEQELSADDGTSDGSGLLADGLFLVTRLTPATYPVKVTAVKLFFVKFADEPSPVGVKARLVVFTDPSGGGRPPKNPRFVVDREISVPSTGQFVTFPVDGPTVANGDVYVGYQALRPAAGVGFAVDSNGPARDRGFWSKDDGATFTGPLQFTDGGTVNPLMRALVRSVAADGGDSSELSADDGSIETGLLRDGGVYVNRLTPPRYPATLKKLRFYLPSFSGQPSPTGKAIRLIVFRDPEAKGTPPANPTLDIDRSVTIPATGEFIDFTVDDLVVSAGDLYVGYQAPSPHEGVGFALDWNGPKASRAFRSTDSGRTFSGPLEVTYNGTTALANLMLRAVVGFGERPSGGLTLTSDADCFDLSEGGESATVRVGARSASPVRITAKIEPSNTAATVSVQPETIAPGQQATVTLSGLGASSDDGFKVVLSATAEGQSGTLELPAYRWALVAQQTVGPDGLNFTAGEVAVSVPKSAFAAPVNLRVLRGKPKTGLEEFHASGVYRLEGLPDDFKGDIAVTHVSGAKPQARFATGPASAAAVLVNGRPRLVGTTPATNGPTATINAKKYKLEKKFTIWFVAGYYAADTKSGRFRIFYPINFKEAAEALGARLDQAADLLESESIGLYFTARTSLPVEVTLQPLRDTLDGDCDGEVLRFNTLRLNSNEKLEAFRAAPGHELMHLVQALFGGNAPTSALWYGTYPWYWMDDALSTWFEPFAMRDQSYIPTTVCPSCGAGTSSSTNYLNFVLRGLANPPGDASDQEHGYGASMFLTTAYRADSRLVARILKERNASEAAVISLGRAMGGPDELSKAWGMFANKYFSGDIYPGRKFPKLTDLTPTGASTINAFEKADSHHFSWFGAPELSVNMFSVKFRDPKDVPDLTDETVAAVTIDEGYDDVDVHAYSYDANTVEYHGSVSGKRELLLPDAKKLAAGRKSVFLGVANKKASAAYDTKRDITVKFGLAAPTMQIYPDFTRMKGVTKHEYEFTTKNRNVPADAQYTWTLGSTSKQGRTVKHAFTNPGDYDIEVKTRVGTKDITDRIRFTIAPDVEVKKVEVLFEVFRNLKTPVGTSKQACNNYTISIFDSRGGLIEAGESIAKNGAYTAIMQPGTGYEARVRYTYTTPCADSGQRSQKFDVGQGTIQGVRIETPPCERN